MEEALKLQMYYLFPWNNIYPKDSNKIMNVFIKRVLSGSINYLIGRIK